MTAETPYRNVRPEVEYVGDRACALCHTAQTETFRQHPMGRSLAAVGPRDDRPAKNHFEKLGSLFAVEWRGKRLLHRETDRGSRGEENVAQEAEIAYVVGSGIHGHSYLIDRDGFLFMSSISWYARKQAWDLSPGFPTSNHFTRPTTAGCLFCHCNQTAPVADTANRFRQPIFQGCAIGCERCHGPGALHVALRERGDAVEGTDTSIVNPRDLVPDLREAVCEQCHLQGASRILRRGRAWFDFRPGLPLSSFVSVFVRLGTTKETDVVGHVEQMRSSRCFARSEGKLGCISCHDPHCVPAPTERVAFYRSGCLRCHTDASCALPSAARRRQDLADSCIGCHMPRADSPTVGHVVLTDHRIRRAPAAADEGPAGARADAGMPLLPYGSGAASSADAENRRDFALALMESARTRLLADSGRQLHRARMGEAALPLLTAALTRVPDDVPAREAKAHALWFLGSLVEALGEFERTLGHAPLREDSLAGAASVAEALGQTAAALDFGERLVRVDPMSWEHRHQLARALAASGRWRQADAECREALALNPFSGPVRSLRVRCLLAAGDLLEAEKEFNRLLPMVQDPEALRRWFAAQRNDAAKPRSHK